MPYTSSLTSLLTCDPLTQCQELLSMPKDQIAFRARPPFMSCHLMVRLKQYTAALALYLSGILLNVI